LSSATFPGGGSPAKVKEKVNSPDGGRKMVHKDEGKKKGGGGGGVFFTETALPQKGGKVFALQEREKKGGKSDLEKKNMLTKIENTYLEELLTKEKEKEKPIFSPRAVHLPARTESQMEKENTNLPGELAPKKLHLSASRASSECRNGHKYV